MLTFPDRTELPSYQVRYENNVLAIEFDTPLRITLPDVALAMPQYAGIARLDPDRRGIRFGLKRPIRLNEIVAGEKLFIDLLPEGWTGLPPSLPPEVVRELAQRAKLSAELAEQQRKAELARQLQPEATVRVGRNPTFVRVEFDWNVDTRGTFSQEGETGELSFDWPVEIDLYELLADLPAPILDATNAVTPDGSSVELKLAEGVTPRFYQNTAKQFIIDIDIPPEDGLAAALEREAVEAEALLAAEQQISADAPDGAVAFDPATGDTAMREDAPLVPQVSEVGNTVRIAFPFEADTAAAVYRRGDTVWMVFDTKRPVGAPEESDALSQIADGMEVVSGDGAQVLRLDLSADRLASLASEGRSWVVSLGDVLLNATEPLGLRRERNKFGEYEMLADLRRPGQVHTINDPDVGDSLKVVTVMPPARGLGRNQRFVDFDALSSAHGLVIRPRTADLSVEIENRDAVIRQESGLTLSAVEAVRTLDGGNAPQFREAYFDIDRWTVASPIEITQRAEEITTRAAESEGRLRDVARLDLAQFLLANRLTLESIGVLDVLDQDLRTEDLRKKMKLTRAVADTLAGRSNDAVATLTTGSFPGESDALMWRAIARTDLRDYAGARADAIAAEAIVPSYPRWVADAFYLDAIRAAIETDDQPLALRFMNKVDFFTLDPEQVTQYQLLLGRIAEMEGEVDEALDHYGQVMAADIRPTRAEAVLRTLELLNRTGRIDLDKATDTLSSEALMWRGDWLEADMRKLLAQLYFRNGDYRDGFETVRGVIAHFPDSDEIDQLLVDAQTAFEDLFLNGAADQVGDLDALALYYDFRNFTPPGARGDEMIRNLARRLVKVDLLEQAGDLLEYQIASRLDGIGKAQVAADLAIIRLANRQPERALRTLNETRLADLPPSLERQRRVLEARALIDDGRQELALDLISRLEGRDADILRVEGYWKSRNYEKAANLLEVMFTQREGDPQMNRRERMNIVRAAVGYVLASDSISLSRLRSKFGDQMANSAEWPLFEFVTRDISPQSLEFRRVASEVAGLDSLTAFLESYRSIYATDEVTPTRVADSGAA
ncbi:tetratricopeptide repeat protein [Devosia sp.]|uniref:tetratricopeptide repeat protein n=1 Tax=Devosia sp. TaxID=1871048 RepID=UPI003A92ACFC